MSLARREDLIERVRQALEGRSEILEAYLFGLRARGDSTPESDIDIAVYLENDARPESPFGYASELASHLRTALHRAARASLRYCTGEPVERQQEHPREFRAA